MNGWMGHELWGWNGGRLERKSSWVWKIGKLKKIKIGKNKKGMKREMERACANQENP
jgi:hypothetical protein